MARCGDVDGVRALLGRGAAGTVVDNDGETPYLAAKHAWTEHREAVEKIYALLRARGFGPVEKPVVVSNAPWLDGSRVSHAQYGEGVLEVSIGRGNDAKLTIQFPSGMKTLLAKFVKRVV